MLCCAVIVFIALTAASAASKDAEKCHSALDSSTTQPQSVAGMHFGAYNQQLAVLGFMHHTYSDPGVQASLSVVPVGALRYPGGTPSNYFNLSNGMFVFPCKEPGEFDLCKSYDSVARWPVETIGPKAFRGNLTTRILGGAAPGNVAYVVNLLTLSGEELFGQVDSLIEGIGADNIQYIELGNEYYLDKYDFKFPNGSSYGALGVTVAKYIKQRLPHCKISFVASFEFEPAGSGSDKLAEWNAQLGSSFGDEIDFVTIHDYRLHWAPHHTGMFKVDKKHQLQALPSEMLELFIGWGPAMIPQFISNVETFYGECTKIFITEHDVSKGTEPAIGNSALRAMYAINYGIAAFCAPNRSVQMSLLHILWGGVDGNVEADYTTVMLPNHNDPITATYSTVAQILSHVTMLGLNLHQQATCMNFASTSACGTPVVVNNASGVQCLHGITFWNSTEGSAGNDSFTAVVVNGCNEELHVELELPMPIIHGRNVTVWTYPHYHTFGADAWVPFPGSSDCGGTLWNPVGSGCNASIVVPQRFQRPVEIGQSSFDVVLEPFSMKIIH